MNDTLEQLRTKLYQAAQEYHQAAVGYYRSLGDTSVEDQKLAADHYKLTGIFYLTALSMIEGHLLASPKDQYLEAELQRIKTTIHFVDSVMKHL